MMGQAAYFNRYAVKTVPYASWRYTSECRRLSSVLDKQLVSSICNTVAARTKQGTFPDTRVFAVILCLCRG